MAYCVSRFQSIRRRSSVVDVGGVGIGGGNPVRVQSMTTTDTQDVAATVRQCVALAEAGCEIIRVTAPNTPAARCLRDIREKFSAAGFARVPLVADIHFLPAAAMEAVEHVEKVRVNPGNYADKKKFAVRDYTDADYERELQRLHEAFTPLVLRAKTLGRALRIGVNHGSLSDRVMNRHGDTPAGMVESALEFLRIAESHSFRQLVLSMKSSNPKVMIQANRLLVARMAEENMGYPLHLGVTEAGDGEDGRIKGAIGIGALLYDGIGDTLRVSLTEDSVHEIPVAQALAAKAHALWQSSAGASSPDTSGTDASSADAGGTGTSSTGFQPVGLAWHGLPARATREARPVRVARATRPWTAPRAAQATTTARTTSTRSTTPAANARQFSSTEITKAMAAPSTPATRRVSSCPRQNRSPPRVKSPLNFARLTRI
ncbi:MAG: (E)-4-hydroxy-3-methylbut-2-enyl-diphosphate synthase [Opitutaceae bacterium]|jgi:(E)-4-hydroxy-3-methylbut-2-enyl-diphosphate synthase|nr:(E)-4-hydroxy-3-methylbut-2-enyl-diphosphate synthase [Opitutaceae bacterium]